MNIVYLAQLVGTVSIFLLFTLQLYIVANQRAWDKSGRIAVLWTVVYVFFLFVLRALQLLGLGTTDQLRIVSGFTTLIPFVAVCVHLFFAKQLPASEDKQISLDEVHQLLSEVKDLHQEAVQTRDTVQTIKTKQK